MFNMLVEECSSIFIHREGEGFELAMIIRCTRLDPLTIRQKTKTIFLFNFLGQEFDCNCTA